MNQCDAIVLGAGIAGMSTANALASQKTKVLVVDRKGLRGQSTPAAGGILDPFLEMKSGSPLFTLSRDSFQAYPAYLKNLENGTGLKSSYQKTGMLYLAFSKNEETELRRRYRWQKKSGIAVEWKSKEWIRKAEPMASSKAIAGLFYSTIGRIRPRDLLRLQWAQSRKLKVSFVRTFQEPEIITHLGKIAGIQIGNRIFRSPVVVNATGSWSGTHSKLGVCPAVKPRRGQIVVVRPGKLKISTILHSLDGAYIVPWKNQAYLVGSTVEEAGFKPKVTEAKIRDILRRAERLLPGIGRARRLETWAGLRPYSVRRLPYIGRTSIPGLFLCTGFYRSGILIGPHVGSLLSRGILSGKMPKILAPFDPKL